LGLVLVELFNRWKNASEVLGQFQEWKSRDSVGMSKCERGGGAQSLGGLALARAVACVCARRRRPREHGLMGTPRLVTSESALRRYRLPLSAVRHGGVTANLLASMRPRRSDDRRTRGTAGDEDQRGGAGGAAEYRCRFRYSSSSGLRGGGYGRARRSRVPAPA
jgi:hypothetical protein